MDARPSDSIALALRMKAPIFAAAELLTEDLEIPTSEESPSEGTKKPPRKPTPEERADHLRRFIEEIDPEDFGKYEI